METWIRAPRKGQNCTIIGEVAQAHDGSLGMAHAFIDAIAGAGADAVKFQTHIASAESTLQEPWRKRFSPQDDTRFDYWKRMEFTADQWQGLKDHATDKGLAFLSSPFSLEALDLLKHVGVAAWKVASGEITNHPMLDAMADTGLPVMLSTGMSGYEDIDAAVVRVRSRVPFAVMQCASIYPSPPEAVGLNLLADFRERYDCAVGISDHSAKIYPAVAAATLGAEIVEVHVTLSRDMFGPDVSASVTVDEFRQLVEGVRFVETMRRHPVDKAVPSEAAAPLRSIFMKSVVASRDLAAGATLTLADLTSKKPGTGIPASRLHELPGRRLRHAIARDAQFVEADLE